MWTGRIPRRALIATARMIATSALGCGEPGGAARRGAPQKCVPPQERCNEGNIVNAIKGKSSERNDVALECVLGGAF